MTSLQQGISTALHETLLPSEEKKESSFKWEEDSDTEDNSISNLENGSSSSSSGQKKQKTKTAKPSAKQILLIPGEIVVAQITNYFRHSGI